MITQIQTQPEQSIKLGEGIDTELINERIDKVFYGIRRIRFNAVKHNDR